MAFTPPGVDEIEQDQPKFTPPAPDDIDIGANIKLTDYDKYKMAVAAGAPPENYSELPLGQTPNPYNPDWDLVRAGGPVPGVLPAINKAMELVGDTAVKVMDIPTKLHNKAIHAEDWNNPFHKETLEERTAGGQNIITIPHAPSMEGHGTIPQIAEGISNLAADTATGLIGRPQSAILLPLVPGEGAVGKLASTAFGATTAAHIPEGIAKAIEVASDPNASVAEKTEAIGNPLVQAALAKSMLQHGIAEGGPRASQVQETAAVHGDVRPQPEQSAGPLPQQEGGGRVFTPPKPTEAQVPLNEEHQTLLDPHMADGRGVFTTLEDGRVMRANHETGQVEVDPEEFRKWVDQDLKDLSPSEKKSAVASAFEHEDIHLKTDPEDAEPFWNSLSPFEQYVLKRQYLKGRGGESPQNLGFEAIRNRVEQAMGMTRSDFVGLALHEKWTAQALDMLANIVGKIRRFRDKELSAHQKSILDKVTDNIAAARNAVPASTAVDQPFMRRQEDEPGGPPPSEKVAEFLKRAPGETTPKDVLAMDDEDTRQYFDGIRKQGNAVQNDAVLAGMRMSPGDIPELTRLRDEMHRTAMRRLEENIKTGNPQTPSEFGKVIWLNGALEGAARKGPNYESVVTRRREGGPAMRRKQGKAGEQEEMFGAVTRLGVPGGEDVQPTSAGELGATHTKPELKISPREVQFEQQSKELPVRAITPSEAKSPAELAKFLTADARKEGSDLPVSMTRRLTAIVSKADGTVHLVSTYPGDGKVRMVDPEIAGKERPNRPIDEILPRYQPIATFLLTEPKQNFHQAFDSIADFHSMFADEVSAGLREQGTGRFEGIPMSDAEMKFKYPKEPQTQARRPEASELRAFHDFFGDTIPSDRTMFERRLMKAAVGANRQMISGLEKLMQIEMRQNRGMSPGDALSNVLDRLYENITQSDTRSDFIKRTMEQSRPTSLEGDPETQAAIRRTLAEFERQKRSGARDLSTLRSRAPTETGVTRKGEVAMPEGVPARPPELLSPEDRARLDAEIEKEHNTLPQKRSALLMKSIAESPVQKERYTVAGSRSIQEGGPKVEELTDDETEGPQSELFPSRDVESEEPPKPESKEELADEKKVVAKGEGAAGQLDFFKKQGPAMLRKVEDTAEKVKDYLRRTGQNIASAGDLSDQLYRLKTSEKADYDLALPVIKSALKVIPEADRPKLLQYADEMQVLKKSDIKLTDAQEAMYQTFLKPLLDDNQRMYRSLMRNGIPVGESTYLGRVVQDTHSLYNRLWRGTKQRITEGSILGQGASFFKRRVFKALEGPNGERQLIALVGDGKDTRVIAYNKGKAELLGKMPPESLEVKKLTPQQQRTQRIVEARRLQELDKLDKEEFALLKEKDRLSKLPNADPAQVQGIEDRLASINGDYAEVGEKYPSPLFDLPRMWKDKNGKTWRFTDATINEIEGNTNTRYYQEPMSGIITQNLKLKQIYRANQFLEDLKNSPDFQRISRSTSERNVPEDWRTVDLPQFRGLRIEPRTADVLDLFSQEQRGPSLPMKYVTKLTNFLRNALFVWNPFVHEPNLLAHWFTARGIEWGKPLGYDRMVRSGVSALTDVLTRSRFRDEALRAGAPLLRGMGDINRQVMKLLQKELDPNPALATKIARALGQINPLRMVRAFGDSLTWGTNEVLTLQLIRETMDRTGLSLHDAIEEVGKHMPNYRIPPRVLNSRLIAHVMRNPLVTLWGHYHYGALKSYGEMAKEVLSPSSSMERRIEGLGRVATIGFLMALAYPAIDDIVNKVLKTKGLKMRRAGSATAPQNLLDMVRGKKTPEAVVQSVLTPSPVTQSAFELGFNRNLRTGLPVYERRLGTQTLKDLGSFAANKISPVEEAGRVLGGKKSLEEFGLGLAGITRTRADSAMSRFGRFADDWMRTNPDESIRDEYKRRTQDVFQESDYQMLRSAIIREDNRAAQMAVDKLLKTRKPEEVNRRIKQWQDSPFTGTRKTDKALMEEMTPKDWDLWYQAAQERLDIADGMRNALVDALVKPEK